MGARHGSRFYHPPMQNWKDFPRFALLGFLLIGLFAGMLMPHVQSVEAKPLGAADELNVLISEFRTRGPGGADDEFVEIYNASGNPIDISGWSLYKSSGCGSTETPLITIPSIPSIITLAPGQHYLIGKLGTYLGTPTADLSYTVAGVADNGGIALLDTSNNPIDLVGMCSDTEYLEGTSLAPLDDSVEQSYERKTSSSAGSCKDTDNNSADFLFNSTSSNPQNLSSPFLPCLVVTDVSSTDGSYTAGDLIDITVTFSNNVNVTGTPLLLLETGTTDRNATYFSGSGGSTLTFRYTVVSGDSSLDLDYVSANALTLNDGTITGAIGDAVLILPKPGDPASLSDNNNIQIDSSGNPTVASITRQDPLTTPTNSNALVFRVTFNEAVMNVGVADFDAIGTTDAPNLVTPISGNIYDVTVSGGDIAGLNGVVGLDLAAAPNLDITDVNGNPLITAEPSVDETYTVDNTSPNVTVNQSSTQSDPATTQPVNFSVVFSEPIDTATFTVSDIDQTGSTASGISWSIIDSGNHINFTLSATATDNNGLIVAALPGGRVNDLAGNPNNNSTSTDNQVTLNDTIPPTVTINQSASQLDPASGLPIVFSVVFSEPINAGLFTASDITQTGTATDVTWSIVDTGDHRNFDLSATSTTGYGTIIPIMMANRVTDFSGNNNTASTHTDNSVTYLSSGVRSVILNEVAWAGTTSSLTEDEWIELYNPSSTAINISGWTLKAADGTPNIPLNGSIPAGGYFLLERDNDNTVSDILADQVYTGEMSNSGEALTLYDGSNKVIDTANGNGGAWPRGSSSTYGTMERNGTSTESDSAWLTNTGITKNGKNANGGDILGTPKNINAPAPTPTPTLARTLTPTPVFIGTPIPIDPRPIINEILPRPGYDWNGDGKVDVYDEFIEIKNLTAVDINLNGWRLDDDANVGSQPYTIPSIILRPDERVVFFALETNILLSDGGDTVRLISPNGKIYDAYTYAIARAEDQSICRLPDGNVFNGWFEDCVPSPKLANTREGKAPSGVDNAPSPVCDLPDTIPADFFFAECRSYGANIWNPFYWDKLGWLDKIFILPNAGKWKSFVE